MSDRPKIPREVKQEVRQRCCFGCVICGIPICAIDHIDDYSRVLEHDPANLVLLCDRHHGEKTRKLLPPDAVKAAQADPFNCRQGPSPSYPLYYSGDKCEVLIGPTVRHTWASFPDCEWTLPFVIDDTPIIGFKREDEQLLLTLQLFNDQNELVVWVVENELRYVSLPWDIEWSGTRMTVRSARREILAQLNFDPANHRVVVERAQLWRNGIHVDVGPSGVVLPGGEPLVVDADDRSVGVALGNFPPLGEAAYSWKDPPREECEHAFSTEPLVQVMNRELLEPLYEVDRVAIAEIIAKRYPTEAEAKEEYDRFVAWASGRAGSTVVRLILVDGFAVAVADLSGQAQEFAWRGEDMTLGDGEIELLIRGVNVVVSHDGRMLRFRYPPGRAISRRSDGAWQVPGFYE